MGLRHTDVPAQHGKDWTVEGVYRKDKGTTGFDHDFFARSLQNVGAFILGRNMFGPVRGPWRDDSWKGWWGDTPPWRAPVFVLTHYPRDSIPMQGGTTFHFVTDGIHRALERATAAANGKDVRIGGIATVQQYLRAGLVDELHLAISPVLLGSGERFLGDIDLVKLGYTCTEHVAGERATHVVLTRREALKGKSAWAFPDSPEAQLSGSQVQGSTTGADCGRRPVSTNGHGQPMEFTCPGVTRVAIDRTVAHPQ